MIKCKHLIMPLLFLMTLCSGCGPVWGLVADALPKPDIPAEYDSSGKDIAVYVSSTGHSELNPAFKRELTTRLNKELLTNNAAESTVSYTSLSDLKLNTTEVVNVDLIRKSFQTDIIIAIEIEQFIINYMDTDNMGVGQVLCFVSVIDSSNGQRLWPKDKLRNTYSIKSGLDHDSEIKLTNSLIQRDLAEVTAQKLGKLFYKHKAEK